VSVASAPPSEPASPSTPAPSSAPAAEAATPANATVPVAAGAASAATAPSPTLPAPSGGASASGTGAPTVALGRSLVHVASNRPAAWLEAKSTLEDGDWQRLCAAPCDREIVVQGALLRVTAPGMTPSNGFRIEPGPGTALVKVEAGSASSRRYGILALGAGIPISLAGMGLYGYGRYVDQQGTQTAGAIVLGVGALAVLVSLPLLVSGATDVRDGKGGLIARLLGDGRLRL